MVSNREKVFSLFIKSIRLFYFIFLFLSLILSSCTNIHENSDLIENVAMSASLTDIPTSTSSPTVTVVPTFSSTVTKTHTPEPTSTPIHPVGSLEYHKANETIPYDWFSYVPSSISKKEKSYILIGGPFAVCPPSDNYSDATDIGRSIAKSYIYTAEKERYIYLLPIIPRPSTNHVYAVAFDWKVFLSSSDPFVQRPDLKVNLMIEKLQSDLSYDGYNIQDRIFIEGFSAGGMFAQRYALLHPEKVMGIAAGQSGGSIVLPLSEYEGIDLEWPVGISDFSSLVGENFNQEEYKQLPQYIYIGDADINNSTLWGINELWRSHSQINFMNSYFGFSDPVRLKNECEYLIDQGYDIIFKEYEGVGHTYTDEMRNDVYTFFDSIRSGTVFEYQHTSTPIPSLLYNIDGYANDWDGLLFRNDVVGDSIDGKSDLFRYSFDEDNYFFYIFVEAVEPFTKEYSVLDIGLFLKNANIQNFELNVGSDGYIGGGKDLDSWYSIPGSSVAWNDVVEIQIPKDAFLLTDHFDYISVKFISLFTDVNGNWEPVDIIE